MGLSDLRDFLRRHKRVALDSSIFIYQLEANPRYVALTDQIFSWVERPGHQAITSAITMLEALVRPYRESDAHRLGKFYGLLATYPNLRWMEADLVVADVAAQIRATFRLRTPDAVQAASAVRAQATGLITNDRVFARVPEFETLVLDELSDPSEP